MPWSCGSCGGFELARQSIWACVPLQSSVLAGWLTEPAPRVGLGAQLCFCSGKLALCHHWARESRKQSKGANLTSAEQKGESVTLH